MACWVVQCQLIRPLCNRFYFLFFWMLCAWLMIVLARRFTRHIFLSSLFLLLLLFLSLSLLVVFSTSTLTMKHILWLLLNLSFRHLHCYNYYCFLLCCHRGVVILRDSSWSKSIRSFPNDGVHTIGNGCVEWY